MLCYENESSIKLHDQGMSLILKALSDVHPSKVNERIFSDIPQSEQESVIKSYVLFLFRTLRYIFAVERNRKLVKQVFPPRLFAMFVDVGNYVNDLEKYTSVL